MSDRVSPREELPLPTLHVLQKKGGSASIREISEDMASLLGLTDAAREVIHGSGPQSEFDYQAAWARTYLRVMGAAENSSRGVWSITDYGRELVAQAAMDEIEVNRRILEHIRDYRRSLGSTRRTRATDEGEDPETKSGDENTEAEWTADLLSTLKEMAPDAFERLCQRILRESGFTKVEVTGRSDDGGIDGIGVLRVNLISFKIVFQCKRYRDSVGSAAIREFRGSVVGKADKGLFMTTGRFTRAAQNDAVEGVGAGAIDLIDGEALCKLLQDLQLGVKTDLVEKVTVEPAFFASI